MICLVFRGHALRQHWTIRKDEADRSKRNLRSQRSGCAISLHSSSRCFKPSWRVRTTSDTWHCQCETSQGEVLPTVSATRGVKFQLSKNLLRGRQDWLDINWVRVTVGSTLLQGAFHEKSLRADKSLAQFPLHYWEDVHLPKHHLWCWQQLSLAAHLSWARGPLGCEANNWICSGSIRATGFSPRAAWLHHSMRLTAGRDSARRCRGHEYWDLILCRLQFK